MRGQAELHIVFSQLILVVAGHVVEFCQDQNGSRFIQQRLEVGDTGEKEVVMIEVLPAVRRLRNDVFGNYVVQKLLDFGTPRMKGDLRDSLQGEMLQLSLQMYGYVFKRDSTKPSSCMTRKLTFSVRVAGAESFKKLWKHWMKLTYLGYLRNSTIMSSAAFMTRMATMLFKNVSK
jgi:hypothetical protein